MGGCLFGVYLDLVCYCYGLVLLLVWVGGCIVLIYLVVVVILVWWVWFGFVWLGWVCVWWIFGLFWFGGFWFVCVVIDLLVVVEFDVWVGCLVCGWFLVVI